MENVKQQIMVLPNIYNNNSSSRIIGFMISHILRDFLYHREGALEYFAADYEQGLDLTKPHRPDVILLDRSESEEEAEKAIALAETANRNSRIIMDYDDEYLKGKAIGPRSKVFTYSAEDPNANFYAQKITERREGGYTMEIVFQVNPKGNKGLSAIFFPTFNRGLVFKTAINSNDRADVVHAVKAFAAGCAVSIEPKYIAREISNFVFDGFKETEAVEDEEPKEEKIEEIMDRKEFEED